MDRHRSEYPFSRAFSAVINNGSGYCHAAAHGNATGFYTAGGQAIYTNTAAAAQTNGMSKLVVLNSMACIAGNFENQSCVSVSLPNNANGGSVANMLNSREGWGTPPTMGPNERFDAKFYDFLIRQDTFLIGPAFTRSKDYFASLAQSQEVWRWCFYDLNLLGDPGMPLWTDAPGTMNVTVPDSVSTGTGTVHVTVKKGDSALTNAAIGFYKAGEVCARATTNASGVADVFVSPGTTGELYITVSAQNRLPVTDSARVYQGAAMPYIQFGSLVVDDNGGSNPNGQLDPGESANLIVTVEEPRRRRRLWTIGKLRTASHYITLLDSSSDFGTINAGDSASAGVGRVTASASTPAGTPNQFHAARDRGRRRAGTCRSVPTVGVARSSRVGRGPI